MRIRRRGATVILTGAGDKAFAAGADIAEMANDSPADAEDKTRHGQRRRQKGAARRPAGNQLASSKSIRLPLLQMGAFKLHVRVPQRHELLHPFQPCLAPSFRRR